MLTEEQKKDFENLVNFYSLQKSYDSESRAELIDKMAGLRSAVSILGYKFMVDKKEEAFGVIYTSYRLEEIEDGVTLIDKNQIAITSHSQLRTGKGLASYIFDKSLIKEASFVKR